MGVSISEILVGDDVSISDLKNKTLAVDAFNTLYMFLTTIRGADGSPLMDENGNITSHLQGIFSRFSNLLSEGIKFIFVFDGVAPKLKEQERKRRSDIKKEAIRLFEKAKQEDDVENMKKYAARAVFLSSDMIEEAKELIRAMGMAIVEAPSEGEAQAARIVNNGDAFAVVSQDADALLAGAKRVIRNLSISKRRKVTGSLSSQIVEPSIFEIDRTLKELDLSLDQLIVLSILIGTDYNYGGVKGIGPKKGIKLVKKFDDDFDALFKEVNWSEFFDFGWKKVFDTIKNMEVSDDYSLNFSPPDFDLIRKILVDNHQFSLERVESTFKKLEQAKSLFAQKDLSSFFG